MAFDSDDIERAQLARLADLDATAPRDAFVEDGRHLWPAVRYALWIYVRRRLRHRRRFQDFDPFNHALSPAARARYEAVADRVTALAGTPTDILVVTPVRPSLLRAEVPKGPLADPLVDAVVRTLGTRWTVRKLAMVGRDGYSLDDWHAIAMRYVTPDPHRRQLDPEALRRMRPSLRWCAGSLDLRIDDDLFAQHLGSYLSLVDSWRRVLEAHRPRLVLFTALGQHMPLAAAASALGIPAVELQHGVIRALSALHNGWHGVPPTGWPSLPTHIWCWTKDDAQHVETAFSGAVRGELVGRPGPTPEPPSARAPTRVVLTLQDQARFPPLLATLVERHCELEWVIVRHPKWNRIGARSLPRGDHVVDGGDRPLWYWLEGAQSHVTRDSAAIWDASTLGVPSYVYGLGGQLAFAAEIARGEVRPLRTPADFTIPEAAMSQPRILPFEPLAAAERLLGETGRFASNVAAGR